jgi:hypothetical protein
LDHPPNFHELVEGAPGADRAIMPNSRRSGRCVCKIIAPLVVVAISAGCNRTYFNVAPVHGRISVDDKPLFQGRVMFSPIASGDQDEPGKPAFSGINQHGEYRLTTFAKDDGAVLGDHWVTIINLGEDLPDGVPEFDRITSPQKVTVVAGKDSQIDINLTSAVVKKYGAENR